MVAPVSHVSMVSVFFINCLTWPFKKKTVNEVWWCPVPLFSFIIYSDSHFICLCTSADRTALTVTHTILYRDVFRVRGHGQLQTQQMSRFISPCSVMYCILFMSYLTFRCIQTSYMFHRGLMKPLWCVCSKRYLISVSLFIDVPLSVSACTLC